VDGALAATGDGVMYVPTRSTWSNGFFIGSDNAGFEQDRGALFDIFVWGVECGGYYTNSWPFVSNALAAWQASPGGGFGGMMGQPAGPGYIPNYPYTTNYSNYNEFWLTANLSSNGTQALVTVQNSLSNLTYNIVTNSALGSNAPEWRIFETVTATNSVIVADPITLGPTNLFVQAELVLNTCPNNCPLPDWMSMLYFNSLCVPPVGGYLTNGLVAYWKMNDGSGTTAQDSSGNPVAMPLTNSPSWGSNYLILNGTNQYGDAGSNALTSLDNHDMTICAWINTLSTAPQGIVDKDYYFDHGDYGGWCFLLDNGQLSWSLENGPGLIDAGAATVPLGQWTFVAVTWYYPNNSANQAGFYINGVLNSTVGDDNVTEAASGLARLEVGNIRNNLSNGFFAFDGSMHDVAIYNRALMSSEIAFNFLSTEFNTNVSKPELLYYKMTEYGETNTPTMILSNSAIAGVANGTVWNYNTNLASLTEWTENPGGYPNTAIHFHGTNVTYIDTGNSARFNFTNNPFTINLWLRPYTEGTYYLGNDSYATNGWYLAGLAGSTGLAFGGETYPVDNAIQATNTISGWPTTSWNMVTITYDGTNTLLIYVNAEPQVTSGTFACPAPSPNNLTFGIAPYFYGSPSLDGDLWLPQIWNSVLSPIDIANLYYNQIHGTPWP